MAAFENTRSARAPFKGHIEICCRLGCLLCPVIIPDCANARGPHRNFWRMLASISRVLFVFLPFSGCAEAALHSTRFSGILLVRNGARNGQPLSLLFHESQVSL